VTTGDLIKTKSSGNILSSGNMQHATFPTYASVS